MKVLDLLKDLKKVNYIYLFLLAVILTSCNGDKSSNGGNVFLLKSDLEETDGAFFITDIGENIKGAKDISNAYSHSGKSSIKLSSKSPYGLDFKIKNVKKGDVIKASVWRRSKNGKGTISVSDSPEDSKQLTMSGGPVQKENGWELIQSYFVAREDYDKVNIYVFASTDEPIYFDDLKIEMYSNNSKPDDSYDALEINISEANYNLLSTYRDTALENGLINAAEKKYVAGTISVDGVEMPAEIRLKGDWTDHLVTSKWSFRIKLKGDNRFNGLKTFSIQNPSTRSFMKEWFAHKLFEKEDVLTTSYSFIPVIVNGEKKGVYAIEEHFDKQLLESRNRREAPIVKFDESGMWEQMSHAKKHDVYYTPPYLASANIIPFKKKRTYKSLSLLSLFKIAQSQMNKYRNFDEDVESYLDVESVAKYMALCDVLNGKHGLAWHNQRFYINPITSKLEPIGFDCFGEHSNYSGGIVGLEKGEKYRLLQTALQNKALSGAYEKYLKTFSNEEYFENVLKSLSEEIYYLEELFHFEDPSFKFESDYFVRISERIRKQLPEYVNHRKKELKVFPLVKKYSKLEKNLIFENIALKAYREKKDSVSTSIAFRNYHLEDIEIIGYSVKKNLDSIIPIPAILLLKFEQTFSEDMSKLKGNVKRIYYKASNCGDKVFSSSVIKWGSPTNIDFINKQLPSFIKLDDGSNQYRISAGRYIIRKDIVIPKGYSLYVNGGADLDFLNGAAFLSYSPVNLLGDSLNQIVIRSSDKSAAGFTVLASNTESNVSYTHFSDFKSLNKEHKSLTGAVTFYESNVKFDHCSFLDNNCEDGLNLIRCDFEMNNSRVENTLSDGFDADFCSGSVVNCVFKNTGNDGIDFSGSEILIEDCLIESAGDKGISGGEKSKLKIINCEIRDVNIAIASKDLSALDVSNVSITNSNFSFAAYRKKPEYGPAKIIVHSVEVDNSKNLHLLEKGSELIYLKKKYIGHEVFDIDSMYLQFK